MSTTSQQSFHASHIWRLKSKSSTHHLSPSWETWWVSVLSRWTLPRCQLSCPGRPLNHWSSCNSFWGSSTWPLTWGDQIFLLTSLTWEIEEHVRVTLQGQPGPISCLTDHLFVPPMLRPDVLQTYLAPRYPVDWGGLAAQVLVGHCGGRHPGVCQCLSCLQPA